MSAGTTNIQANFELYLHFAVPAERLFAALATADGIKSWWTRFCEVSESVASQSSLHFPNAGFFAVMKILRREPPRLLEWECVDSNYNENTGYTDLRDWGSPRGFDSRFGIWAAGSHNLTSLTSVSINWSAMTPVLAGGRFSSMRACAATWKRAKANHGMKSVEMYKNIA
ncbi:MAG: SRPBCC family protein [Halobacteriota archaeon]